MQFRLAFALLATILFLASPFGVRAADWPTWRYDANRTGVSPHGLSAKLHLQWKREYRPTTAAWPDQAKMQFDIVREPVVIGQTMFFNSSRYDAVRAIDTRTGAERWTYFADGPIRFAPVAWEDKVYFTSDDGYLYCLKADAGTLLWKFRGGPNDRKILGNDRLISTWPARGAPVIADGKVYFAASIWPFMGIFLHAVDAKTGTAIWTSDGDGSLYMKQPHNSDSFASIAPQGPLVAIGDKLLVPGGRSVPAYFDRNTGKLLRYQLNDNAKRGGGSKVGAINDLVFNGGGIFDLSSEKYLGDSGKLFALTKTHAFTWDKNVCKVFDLKNIKTQEAETVDAKGKKTKVSRWVMPELASTKVMDVETIMMAGSRLYLGGPDHVTVLDWDAEKKQLTPSWNVKIQGTVIRMVAADDRLFVVAREGGIYCFGAEETKPIIHAKPKDQAPSITPLVKSRAEEILSAARTREGYAVVWGVGDGRLCEALARLSKLHLIVVEPDPKKVQAFRSKWLNNGLYGTRIAIIPGDADSVQLPPYFASVMICENPDIVGASFVSKAYSSLRPFGGTLCFVASERDQKLHAILKDQKLTNAKTVSSQTLVSVVREGALPGSANWTHENADASNTRVSRDVLVKAPMGVLWFGGPSNENILPRHGHGPQPQVIDGRMIIEGMDLMRAIDIYTGRLLWETKLPGVGFFYNNLAHQAGANASGSNFVSTSDGIYVVHDKSCVRLDPETGKKIGTFTMPNLSEKKETPRWGYINVVGNYLIGGSDPLFDAKTAPPKLKPGQIGKDKEPEKKDSALTKLLKNVKGFSDNFSSSKHLVIMDRKTGKVAWTATAKYGFRHHAICVGGGRLYAIDRLSGDQLARYTKDEKEPPFPPRLIAFDLETGKEIWSSEKEVFGTWLSYSEKRDVLVEAGRVARDSLFDEPKGMRAYRAKDGGQIWFEKSYTGPAMIHGDTVLQGQGGCDLLTGALKMRKDPLTEELVPWTWLRNHGCNTPMASEHLMTFRSGAAGYFDLCNDGGTGNFGGFRSSCSNNLVVAGGILTAPEYTRTCTCAYQNQTSIALIHMPEAEMWTSFGSKDIKGTIKRLGLNFGAPGDRKADDGTLWLEQPSIGGTSPNVQVTTKPAAPEMFRRHPLSVEGPNSWITSSGLKGVNEVTVTLGKMDAPATYTVRLYFAEPDDIAAGKRVFHVLIQGKQVLSDFDIVKEAGGRARSVIKEFKGISAQGQLTVRLDPSVHAAVRAPILCGVELISEEKK
jgi:outer membrane protein assembly factor BamB